MDELTYIAAYFEGTLPEEEKTVFEKRCQDDPLFAGEVADYIRMRDTLKQQLQQDKRVQFDALFKELKSNSVPKTGKKPYYLFKNLSWYAAAACIGLIATWLILFSNHTPRQQAREYISANFSQLGTTMGAEGDSLLQSGINAFNKREYKKALAAFEKLSNDSLLKSEAIKNAGITYLMTKDYDSAISSFDALSKMNLHTNPGLFYKALALLQRSAIGDVDAAKRCLKEVADKHLAGKKEAADWLENL